MKKENNIVIIIVVEKSATKFVHLNWTEEKNSR